MELSTCIVREEDEGAMRGSSNVSPEEWYIAFGNKKESPPPEVRDFVESSSSDGEYIGELGYSRK
jgi:hypothetical protein